MGVDYVKQLLSRIRPAAWNRPHAPKAVILIPAHSGSTRLPNKLLLGKTGKPLILHTYEAAMQSKLASDVRIAPSREFKGQLVAACMKRPGLCVPKMAAASRKSHPNGTSRMIEAALQRYYDCPDGPPEIVVNLQADEPEITGKMIDDVIAAAALMPKPGVATLSRDVRPSEALSADCVKVVAGRDHRALYFSRTLLPSSQAHIGVYAFRWDALCGIHCMQSSVLAEREDLEQLQWLDHGLPIAVEAVDGAPVAVNTLADYDRFVEWWRDRQRQHQHQPGLPGGEKNKNAA